VKYIISFLTGRHPRYRRRLSLSSLIISQDRFQFYYGVVYAQQVPTPSVDFELFYVGIGKGKW